MKQLLNHAGRGSHTQPYLSLQWNISYHFWNKQVVVGIEFVYLFSKLKARGIESKRNSYYNRTTYISTICNL